MFCTVLRYDDVSYSVFDIAPTLASGDTTMNGGSSPGPSVPEPSSHSRKMTPLCLYASVAMIFGTSCESHWSPRAIEPSCMSSSRFGVMNT